MVGFPGLMEMAVHQDSRFGQGVEYLHGEIPGTHRTAAGKS